MYSFEKTSSSLHTNVSVITIGGRIKVSGRHVARARGITLNPPFIFLKVFSRQSCPPLLAHLQPAATSRATRTWCPTDAAHRPRAAGGGTGSPELELVLCRLWGSAAGSAAQSSLGVLPLLLVALVHGCLSFL